MRTREDWTAADAVYIRTVFSQPSGQKFLRKIQGDIPKIISKDREKAFLEAVEKQGAENLYEKLISLAGEIEPEFKEQPLQIDLSKEGD